MDINDLSRINITEQGSTVVPPLRLGEFKRETMDKDLNMPHKIADCTSECWERCTGYTAKRSLEFKDLAHVSAIEGPLEQTSRRGRPRGFDGTRSRMPSALAQSFKKAGLDWKIDFAEAIKANKRERIKLWLKLLPYMITTTKCAKVGAWKGKPSKAAQIALRAMEQEL